MSLYKYLKKIYIYYIRKVRPLNVKPVYKNSESLMKTLGLVLSLSLRIHSRPTASQIPSSTLHWPSVWPIRGADSVEVSDHHLIRLILTPTLCFTFSVTSSNEFLCLQILVSQSWKSTPAPWDYVFYWWSSQRSIAKDNDIN